MEERWKVAMKYMDRFDRCCANAIINKATVNIKNVIDHTTLLAQRNRNLTTVYFRDLTIVAIAENVL